MSLLPDEELAPFVTAVRQEPADPGPRLVLADFLEERYDPRATILRVTPALESVPWGEFDPSTYPMRERTPRRLAVPVYPVLRITDAFPGGMPSRGAHVWARLISIAAFRATLRGELDGPESVWVDAFYAVTSYELYACGLLSDPSQAPHWAYLFPNTRLLVEPVMARCWSGRGGSFVSVMHTLADMVAYRHVPSTLTGAAYHDHVSNLKMCVFLHFEKILRRFRELGLGDAITSLYEAKCARAGAAYQARLHETELARLAFKEEIRERTFRALLARDTETRCNLERIIYYAAWPNMAHGSSRPISVSDARGWAAQGMVNLLACIESSDQCPVVHFATRAGLVVFDFDRETRTIRDLRFGFSFNPHAPVRLG